MAKNQNTIKAMPSSHSKRVIYNSLKNIEPITDRQEQVFISYNKNKNLLLHGYAGTGKTFLALYLALKEVLLKESMYKKVIVIRSTVPSRDQGFLPGSVEEKELIYQLPYKAMVEELFIDKDAYSKLIFQGQYEFISTSYVRGITIRDAIVIVDEVQNCTFEELDSVITRLGENTKCIFCGDFRQTDLKKHDEKSGVLRFMKILDNINSFEHIEFQADDIVRSDLVKSYILAKTELIS